MAKEETFCDIRLNGYVKLYRSFSIQIKKANDVKKLHQVLKNDPLIISDIETDEVGHNIVLKESYLEFLKLREEYMTAQFAETMQKEVRSQKEMDEPGIKITLNNIPRKTVSYRNIDPQAEAAITISPMEQGIGLQMKIDNRLRQYHEKQMESIVFGKNMGSDVFGAASNERISYLLFPLLAIYKDGSHDFVDMQLDLYSNGMVVVTAGFLIQDAAPDPLLRNDQLGYIESLRAVSFMSLNTPLSNALSNMEKWDFEEQNECDIWMMIDKYMMYLEDKIKVAILPGERFYHILISSIIPGLTNFSQMNRETREMLYRIIKCPMDPQINVKDEARSFVEENCWGNSNVHCFFSPTGSCLSITTEQQIQRLMEGEQTREEAEWIACKSMDFGLDVPIQLCLLKKMNYVDVYTKICNKGAHILQFQREFLRTENYILSLQQHCFGSVSELIEHMEEHMPYFFKEKALAKQIHNTEQLIIGRQEIAREQLNLILSIGSFIVAVFFALPVIRETFLIIKAVFSWQDIPYISVDMASVIVWGGLIIMSGVLIAFQQRNKKK